ncbi:DUF4007 family protein [Phormidesmis sp. 146-12]
MNSHHPGSKVIPVFARHETFHVRFGWLKKGFDAASHDPEIFLREDASVRLGVGKNMVRSIRYWCLAFKVLEEQATLRGVYPTEFGQRLLDNEGWDAFLENPASLWLLHWNLLKPACLATAWHFFFNSFRPIEFSTDDACAALNDYCNIFTVKIADSSLKKDLTCILRMYVEQEGKSTASEDSLDCPFTALNILQTAGESGRFAFRMGAKSALPSEIIVAACLEFAAWSGMSQRTIALSRLTFDQNSPGLVFKLTENAIAVAIEDVSRSWSTIQLRETAGLIQMSYNQAPDELSAQLLNRYYNPLT